jgi:hypothetical protein
MERSVFFNLKFFLKEYFSPKIMQRPGDQCAATVRTGTARAAEQNKTENVLMGQRMAGCDNGRLKLPKTPRQLLRCTIFFQADPRMVKVRGKLNQKVAMPFQALR